MIVTNLVRGGTPLEGGSGGRVCIPGVDREAVGVTTALSVLEVTSEAPFSPLKEACSETVENELS